MNDLPIVSTDLGTYKTAERLTRVPGPMLKSSTKKLEVARRLFSEHVDQDALLGAINISGSTVRTPLMFEFQLMERARSSRKHIVLPESTDDRILEAAAILLRRGVAQLTLLGDENTGPSPGLRARVWTSIRPPSSPPPIRSWSSGSLTRTPRPGRTRE